MIIDILIAVLSFGCGAIFGTIWMANIINKAYRKDPKKVILLLEEYKVKWENLRENRN